MNRSLLKYVFTFIWHLLRADTNKARNNKYTTERVMFLIRQFNSYSILHRNTSWAACLDPLLFVKDYKRKTLTNCQFGASFLTYKSSKDWKKWNKWICIAPTTWFVVIHKAILAIFLGAIELTSDKQSLKYVFSNHFNHGNWVSFEIAE